MDAGPPTTLVLGRVSGPGDPEPAAADLAAPVDLLRAVARDPRGGSVVRLYRPLPTVAFSRRERLLPGFEEASRIAESAGFAPVLRPAGGRAVALDDGWLVMDVITPESVRQGDRDVFARHGETFAQWLRRRGLDARVGPVLGEYCPGDYSVNIGGRVKIVGTAQRVVRGARLFAVSIPLHLSRKVAGVLHRVNTALELEWDPATLGALDVEAPDLTAREIKDDLIGLFAAGGSRRASVSDILAGAVPAAT